MAESPPNNSIPIKLHAIGAFVAPEKTATKPNPASNPKGSGIKLIVKEVKFFDSFNC